MSVGYWMKDWTNISAWQLYGPEKEQAVLEARLLVVMVFLHFLQPSCDQERLQRGCDRNIWSCVIVPLKKSLYWICYNIASGFFFFFWCEAYGLSAPQSGMEPGHPALKGRVLTTRLPGKSLHFSAFLPWSLSQCMHIICLNCPEREYSR